MQKSNLLPIYSIQVNMLSAIINEKQDNEVLVLLNNGKELKISCPTDGNAIEIFNCLHFYPVFKSRDNNSIQQDFYFSLEVM